MYRASKGLEDIDRDDQEEEEKEEEEEEEEEVSPYRCIEAWKE